MIRHMTFMNMPDELNLGRFGKEISMVNPWLLLKTCLEESGDTLVWVVTRKQQPAFLTKVKEHDLDRYMIQKHDKLPVDTRYNKNTGEYVYIGEDGVTNHNYPHDPNKLKLFVMKGAKA